MGYDADISPGADYQVDFVARAPGDGGATGSFFIEGMFAVVLEERKQQNIFAVVNMFAHVANRSLLVRVMFTFENRVLLMRYAASVVWHLSLPLMISFNKTEAAIFPCRLCNLRAFPCISLLILYNLHLNPLMCLFAQKHCVAVL